MTTMIRDPYELFIRNRRFDLIYKILYATFVKDRNEVASFYEAVYLEHLRAFNDFYEGRPRRYDADDFLEHFRRTLDQIERDGFDPSKSLVPVGPDDELRNGAHRLAACIVSGRDIHVEEAPIQEERKRRTFDYLFFQDRYLKKSIEELGVLEYVKFNRNAYIVNLFPALRESNYRSALDILNQYGFIYYEKSMPLTHNMCVNIKKITYGKEAWAGGGNGHADDFTALNRHASRCLGEPSLRIVVFVCDSLEKAVAAKTEIRALQNVGNFPVHINDSREEAVELAQTYFNENSLNVVNLRPYNFPTQRLDALIGEFHAYIERHSLDPDRFCMVGSGPLGACGIRENRDLDFLHLDDDLPETGNRLLSSHETCLPHYPCPKHEIILNPDNHFFYKGVKFASPEIIRRMKLRRNEQPKDVDDVRAIDLYLRQNAEVIAQRILYYRRRNPWRFLFRALNSCKRKVTRARRTVKRILETAGILTRKG